MRSANRVSGNPRRFPTRAARLALIVAGLALGGSGADAQQCGVWFGIPAAGNNILGVTHGGGQFVGVGLDGAYTSPDGRSWTTRPIALGGRALVRAAWNGSQYVAVGQTGAIFTSPNGTAWTPQTSPTASALAGIAWGNATWVAVGEFEVILTSPDAVTWTQVQALESGHLTSVVWTGSSFIAVGQGGVVLTSGDGSSWVRSTIPGQDWLTDVISRSGQHIVISFAGTVLSRTVFTPWTPSAETGRELRRIVWTGSKYVAVGNDLAVLSSPNLTQWSNETFDAAPPTRDLTGLAWSGTALVAVGSPAGVFRSDCAAFAEFSFTPAAPAPGQNIDFFATSAQGLQRARWQFGEAGCNGATSSPELACLQGPCTFPTTFAFTSAGDKTVTLHGWSGELDGQGNRIFRLMRTHTVTVAGTGACATCAPPGPPSGPIPADAATSQAGALILQWAAPAVGSPPLAYDVEVDGATACLQTGTRQCGVTVAESMTPHTWRVIARNACGQASSPLWSFVACSQAGPPGVTFAYQPSGPLPSWPAQQQPLEGQAVAFTDQSAGNPQEWLWSGLAAGPVGERDPRRTWWRAGAYDVGLRAANCAGWSDEVTQTVTVSADVRPRQWAFDFGVTGSPVAAGFTGVLPSTAFTPALGYGWLVGTVSGRVRGSGSELERDFNFSPNATFVVNVPDRTYDVTVWMGDRTYAHDSMAVLLEGGQVEVVDTPAGVIVRRVYRVPVADGQLTLRIQDLGGADPNAVINGLEIVSAQRPRVDFGTSASPTAEGFRSASEATTLAPPLWCGWSAGKLASRDRAVGDDVRRDFIFTRDGTFSCALGRWLWDVAITVGDATARHDEMGIFLEGAHVDTLTRGANQFVTRKYRVNVGDGQLTARFADLGGSDANAVVNAIEATSVGPFDFGTPLSPVAAEHQRVSPASRYSAATGSGWLSGTVAARERDTGSPLLRDFNFTALATFVVDVPNGPYDVALTMGDASRAHDLMRIALEGVAVDTVSTGSGNFVVRTYRVTVGDGQLTLGLEDVGGSDSFVVINALSVMPAP